ncbi:hypothetical protein IW261DRAFT_1614539 [Armillaria novae-zelandiae]|uniref:Uncharacterized protein n=1 Tax=Armillaria novae-zelandiae TaxID=153914 RepID=A0AA39T2Y7_9AGAR|nr:hypothetical protein IW261DRAFT_1614539 [Armillaria novae-zelandiae]
MEDWEVPVSEIRSWIYSLIDYWGFDTVISFRNRAMEGPLDERGVQMFACESEVLENHATVSDRVRAWRNNVAVVPSHSPPIHSFDAHRRVFSFFDEPYTPGEAPNEVPPLRALIHDLREAEHTLAPFYHDPYTEPYETAATSYYHGGQPIGVDDDNAKPAIPSASVSTAVAGIYTSSSDVAINDSWLACRIPRSFDGIALIALYEQERKARASDVKE